MYFTILGRPKTVTNYFHWYTNTDITSGYVVVVIAADPLFGYYTTAPNEKVYNVILVV